MISKRWKIHPDGAPHAPREQRGFTFVELSFATLIMVAVALTLVQHVSGVYRRNTKHSDRVRANAVASSILAELQSFVNVSEGVSANALNAFDDGTGYNPVLSIMKEGGQAIEPGHPLSKNMKSQGKWAWARRVTVRPFAGLNNRNVRYVTVKVFRRKRNSEEWERLADLSGVVNSIGSAYPPSQVFDVYLLALENIPGWWVHMDAIRPFVEASITDLEARNPGCKIRTHWITKTSYGRDPTYTPYVNEAVDSLQPSPGVYLYPGKMPAGSASNYCYVPDTMRGRILLDGVLTNGYHVTDNPLPYAFADRFNNGMRYEEERAYFNARMTAGLETADAPTWRLLLEEMARDPQKFHNAIFVNLHGELLPMPTIRNYSDAAKVPGTHPGLRVVTHPERLWTNRDSGGHPDPVKLRVYAYRTNPDTLAAGEERTNGEPISVQIMGADLTGNVNGQGSGPTTLTVQRLSGGIGAVPYSVFSDAPSVAETGMYYSVSYVDNRSTTGEHFTLLELHNTPSICPDVGTQGLAASSRLYGYDYIPCPADAGQLFATNLSTAASGPKNTARWTIEIGGDSLGLVGTGWTNEDRVVEVRTRIGTDLTTGTLYPAPNQPVNVSRTFAYWSADREYVPHTERAQFTGDPRHMPYVDLAQQGNSFPNGYNWFFDNLVDGSNDARSLWPALETGRLRDGWRGRVEADYPRYAELIRKAMTQSEAIYTTLTGFSYYYLGLGGEIGSDGANGYPHSIPINLIPWGSNSVGHINNISGGSGMRSQKVVRTAGSGTTWWGRFWLGELYPDSDHATWSAFGNLPSGGSAGQYYRVQAHDLGSTGMPFGTRLPRSHRTTGQEGCVSIFNIGEYWSTFHHVFSGGDGNIAGAGNDLANNYNFPMPSATPINRPFGITQSYHGWVGDEYWYTAEYPRFTAAIERTYYSKGSLQGSALVGLTTPDGTRTGHIVVNGLSQTVESGSSFIAKYAVLSLLHSFFEAGHPSFAHALTPLPRTTLTFPTEISEISSVTSIDVGWSIEWRRWDGAKYASSFADTYAGNESDLDYALLYSRDGGQTWLYVQDDSPAVAGSRPTSSTHIIEDAGNGDETFTWNVPETSFPEGTYVLRVETYRKGEAMHYSYHQSSFYLQR